MRAAAAAAGPGSSAGKRRRANSGQAVLLTQQALQEDDAQPPATTTSSQTAQARPQLQGVWPRLSTRCAQLGRVCMHCILSSAEGCITSTALPAFATATQQGAGGLDLNSQRIPLLPWPACTGPGPGDKVGKKNI